MSISKRLVCPERERRVPPQFSWIDHRLIREGRLSGCSTAAWALYLFLVTVADSHGLSYYSEKSLCRRIGIGIEVLVRARGELQRAGLIVYESPLYQVLTLDKRSPAPVVIKHIDATTSTEAVSVGEVLRALCAQGGAQ